MTAQPSTNLTVEEALKILKEYSCVQIRTVTSKINSEELRQALLLITNLSEYENLGICADNAEQGFAALSDYLKAFNYDVNVDSFLNSFLNSETEKNSSASQSDRFNANGEKILSVGEKTEFEGAVYLKFNTQKMTYYLDSYTGSYRGVLVSCKSENDTLVGTYGHFPLDLFAET
jgi:hypothetical protein